MANKTERERLAVVEEKVDRQGQDIREVKNDVKQVLSRMDDLENVFVTRREVTLIKGVIGLIATVLGIYISVKGL